MKLNKSVLIMAGGRGERFWPKSRSVLPKQFLSLSSDGKTMIQLTVERILPLVSMDDVYIATNDSYKDLVLEQLPDLPPQNILFEPVGRNTAPCIGLGAIHIAKKHKDAVMFVLPSDHLIKNSDMFLETMTRASETAETGSNLVTIGIRPSYPETGYGYIKYNPDMKTGNAYPVHRFVEKPDFETAKNYVEDGNYLWNSGMFVWKTSTILDNIALHLPEIYKGLKRIESSIGTTDYESTVKTEFPLFTSESIDYGIMEKADSIYIYTGDFGWDDVGSWLALERIRSKNEDGNVLSGNTVTYNTRNCIVEGSDKLIATVGLHDLIIVDTPDATLICDKKNTEDVKKIISRLKESNNNKYL